MTEASQRSSGESGQVSPKEANKPADGSRLDKTLRRITPGKNLRHVFGALALVTAVLAVLAIITTGILATRTAYYEQRNLRELDRVAAELTETRRNLAQTAALHFVPRQLHFILSRRFECLAATTEIMGARQQPMTIVYYFTDPPGSEAIARWYAEQASVSTSTATGRPPRIAGRPLPPDLCGFRRPIGLPFPPETMALDDGRIAVERSARLTDLIWPMTSPNRDARPDLSLCRDDAGQPGGIAATGGARAFIRSCFLEAALEDLRDGVLSHRRPDELRRTLTQSIDAAIQSNAIRINVATRVDAIDFDTSLELFDAVQIIGSDSHDQPILLHQAGRVPAAIERGESDEMLDAIARLAGASPPRPAATGANRPGAIRDRDADLLSESRISKTRDLILFQRTYPRLAGLHCSPCRIVGIVERSKFNQTVRKIDGVQATIFLIGVLTLIGLIPLLQLRLRKRLDATGRPGQYLIWFSLTLLAASATVSVLAIWSSSASRNAGASYARATADQIREEFASELHQTLPLVGSIGAQLEPSRTLFPAPDTLPRRRDLATGSNVLDEQSATAAVKTLAVELKNGIASILEGVAFYRSDGFLDLRTSRFAAARFPAFGTDIGSRSYFNRARNRDYDTIGLPRCPDPRHGARFILDRVFALADGAPRMIWLVPAQDRCLRPPGLPANALGVAGDGEDEQGFLDPTARDDPVASGTLRTFLDPAAADALGVAGGGDDEQTFFDPTARDYLVASGTLRTFLRASPAPGFSYAVVAADRPTSEPNVLFHSRPGAELVERFQHELDHPERFNALVRQVLAPLPASETAAPSTADSELLRLDSNYRARPSRLTIGRLHPSMDWVLVIIEDRDDAGFAVWRAATFGYAIWLIGALTVGLGLLFAHFRQSPALDRRPGLSLWPRERLGSFTPPRLARKADLRERLFAGAALRDRHIWWVLFAGLIGVPAAEGASRILFAFAAATTALVARAYFMGMTTEDDGNARRSSRWTIGLAFAFLLLAAIVFMLAMDADARFRTLLHQPVAWFDFAVVRVVLFSIATLILLRCQLRARRHAGDAIPEPAAPERGWRDRLRVRMSSSGGGWPAPLRWLASLPARVKNLVWRMDIGWMALLVVLGAMPAAAGFLDSYDQDRFLLSARSHQLDRQAHQERTRAIEAINLARFAKLPENVIRNQIIDLPLPPALRSVGRRSFDYCYSLSCFAIFYLDLREQALDYSDFAAFRMGFGTDGALSGARGYSRSMALPFVAAIPLILLVLTLIFFRQQYFHRPPLLSPGKDPDFDPPLSFTRSEFITQALLKAAAGVDPTLPFKPAGGNRHLILGLGMDLRHEWAAGEGKKLDHVEGIEWIDLLNLPEEAEAGRPAQDAAASIGESSLKDEAAEPVPAVETESNATAPPRARTIVIGNLDLALQVPDEGETVDRAYRVIKEISESWEARGDGGHVFLLADIDPLDRLALLWAQQDREAKTSLVKGWRWAELIQDFTLYPIRGDPETEAGAGQSSRLLRTIHEELGMLDIGFARELRDRLIGRLERATRPEKASDPERIVSFITEHMSDHYQKLWASSSDEERVMLFRIARNCHLKMHDSRGLRSLLSRGLLVRVPEYRLMNRSFTRYVCRVGATSEIHRSAERVDGLDWVWPLIRYPLAAAAGAAVLLLQFLAPSNASGAVGALPALLTLIPALLGKWFQDRSGAT